MYNRTTILNLITYLINYTMSRYITIVFDSITGLFDGFREIISNRPFISILFPASGFGATYIPVSNISTANDNLALDIISIATPYLKFIFLLLTLVLTIISLILQCRKMRNKNK